MNIIAKWFLKYKFVYFPLLVFFLYFSFDKVFSNDYYKMLTMDDAPFLIFEYKKKLLNTLPKVRSKMAIENSLPDVGMHRRVQKKSLFVLGTSRLLFMNYKYIKENYPNWEFFNFSGPVTFPAYYLYILERAVAKGFTPDIVIVETAPFQYSDGSDLFLRSNVAYSFDLRFMLEHFNLLKRDEVSYFLARYLFNGYRYPFKMKNIMGRLKNANKNPVLLAFKTIDDFQKKNRGSSRNIIPKDDWYDVNLGALDYKARHKTIPWLYANFKVSMRQFEFLEKLLILAKKNKIKVVMVSPAISSSLQNATQKKVSLDKPIRKYQRVMAKLRAKYSTDFIDFNNHPSYKCNTFVDDAHMSIDCYNLMVDELMRVTH